MRLLCVVDKFGRIQHSRTTLLCSYLPFDSDIISIGQSAKYSKYDAVYYSSYSLIEKQNIPLPKIGSITSHKSLDNIKKTIHLLSQFRCISVNNQFLFKEFSKYRKVHYTPNGVDRDFFQFSPLEYSKPLGLLWVGNRDRAAKNYQLLSNLTNINGINLITVASSKSDSILPKTKFEMRDLYQASHFLLITSSTEGTPNPGLEALSCGTPVISTRVGNMVDLVKDGVNGFFAEPTAQSFKCNIEKGLTLDMAEYNNMRLRARDATADWDWVIRKEPWIAFFKEGMSA